MRILYDQAKLTLSAHAFHRVIGGTSLPNIEMWVPPEGHPQFSLQIFQEDGVSYVDDRQLSHILMKGRPLDS